MRMNVASVVGVVLTVTLVACGGKSPTSPSNGGGGAPGPSGATITITAAGVNPKTVTISVGQSVTFVNDDTGGHQIASNPHPAHTDCPSINALVTIGAGQTKLTNAFTTARSCGFHDHNDETNVKWQGTIVVQ